LAEDTGESVLTVFNWTEKSSSHRFSFADLKLAAGPNHRFTNIFDSQPEVPAIGDSISLEQPAHSVLMLKIVDTAIAAAAPSVSIEAPDHAKVDETIKLAATADPRGVPALTYRWDFGDGTSEQERQVVHAYTTAGNYTVHLTIDGVDGVPAEKQTAISINGSEKIGPPTRYYEEERNTVR
jgi:alpha-galactosidase